MKPLSSRTLKKSAFAATAFLIAACSHGAAGSSFSSPLSYSVGKTQTFTLVNEIYEGELYDSGVAYIKVPLKQGTQYTFWTTGLTEESFVSFDSIVYTYKWDGDLMDSWIGNVEMETKTANYRGYVTSDDWGYLADSEDKPIAYFLVLSGDVGATVTISSSEGIVPEPIPVGDYLNPATFTVASTTETSKSAKLLDDGSYYFLAQKLETGKRYRFATAGGTPAAMLSLDIGGNHAFHTSTTNDANAEAYLIPEAAGDYEISIHGNGGQNASLKYNISPARTPAAHTDLFATLAPSADPWIQANVPVDPRNMTETYYDRIIDSSLIKLTGLKKDTSYLVEAVYADAQSKGTSILEVYNAAGATIQTNRLGGIAPFGQRLVFKPTLDGDYWVGIGQDVFDSTPKYTNLTCTLAIQDLGTLPAEANDTPEGATPLLPKLVAQMSEDSIITNAAFSAANSVDWYRLDSLAGITYSFAAPSIDHIAERPMNLSVYTVDAKGKATLVSGGNLGDPQSTLTFSPAKAGTYYIKASLPDGIGCDYAYTFHSWVNANDYGVLSVDLMGAVDGRWNIKGDTAKFEGGANLLIAKGPKTIQFSTVSGWTKPADTNITVTAGYPATSLVAYYNDTFDAKDHLLASPTALAPTAKGLTLNRSLWSGDPRDLFKLAVKNGTVYTLKLTQTFGAPYIRVYRNAAQAPNGTVSGQIIAEGTDIRFTAREAANYIVEIGHDNPAAPVDSSYVLSALAQNVGTVSIEKAAYTVREGTAKIDIKITRTAKDGAVRVRYSTFEDTAKAGLHYQPASDIIAWKDGESTAKTVSVILIPDLTPTFNPDRAFNLALDLVPEDLTEGNLVPLLNITQSTVTITEVTKQAPGTLGFSGTGDIEPQPFANARTPAVNVAAGERLTLWIDRTAGANGEVGVRVQTLAKTAQPGDHFEEIDQDLIWADGDLTAKEITVDTTLADEAPIPERTFTVKLTALKTTEAAARLGAAAVTVTIRDPGIAQTSAEWLADPETKAIGLTVKDAAKNWFIDQTGNLRSAALTTKPATLTVTAPASGLLLFTPALVGAEAGDTFTGAIARTPAFECDAGEELVKYLAARSTLTFTAKAAAAGGEAYASFFSGGEAPFRWIPVEPAELIGPADKAAINVTAADFEFLWTQPASTNVTFRFLLAESVKGLESNPILEQTGSEHFFCTSCTLQTFEHKKTYYWRVDTLVDLDNATVAEFKGSPRSFTYFEEGAPVTHVLDAAGDPIAGDPATGGIVEFALVQGLAVSIPLATDSNAARLIYTLLSGKLPDGLKLANGLISGVPAKPGSFTATLRATDAASVTLAFSVEPVNLAAGVFNGSFATTNVTAAAEAARQLEFAGAAFTAAATGKLTAKVNWGGKSHAFSGNGFTEDLTDPETGLPCLRAELSAVVKINNVTCTNVFDVTVCRAAAGEPGALDRPAKINRIVLHQSPRTSRTGVIAAAFENGSLFRNNAKEAATLAQAAEWAGYYTVALPFDNTGDTALPNGAGTATLTLDAKGTAKFAGVLPSGSFAAASPPVFVADSDGQGTPIVRIPLYTGTAVTAACGEIILSAETDEDGNPLVVATGTVGWNSVDPKIAPAAGFALEAPAVGGFYDKTTNLQAFYKDFTFKGRLDEAYAPSGLDATYTRLAYLPNGTLDFTLSGDTMTAEKRVLVKNGKLNDFEASVNPSNFTIKFTRATGLFTGTFALWYEGESRGAPVQKEQSVKYQGILVPTQAAASGYGTVPGLGFATLPGGAAPARFSLIAAPRAPWDAEALPELAD